MRGDELRAFARSSLVDAAIILAAGALLTYLLAVMPAQARHTPPYAVGETASFFDYLPIYTLVAALLTMLGKLLGSIGSVSDVGRASVVAESVSGYIEGVTGEAEAMGAHGWLALLAGSAIAVAAALLLSAIS